MKIKIELMKAKYDVGLQGIERQTK